MPPVNGSEAVAFVSMPLKSIRVVADLAFLHNEQTMSRQCTAKFFDVSLDIDVLCDTA